MVFEADELAPSVALDVRSEPAGASVWLGGERIGVTPMVYAYRHAEAAVGRELTLVLKLTGHETKTLRQTITGPELALSAELEPEVDDEMKALGARAAALQKRAAEPAPVLIVKPAAAPARSAIESDDEFGDEPSDSEDVPDDEPADDEPEPVEEPEAKGMGAVQPNPYVPPVPAP
jgi:hypothetical protein